MWRRTATLGIICQYLSGPTSSIGLKSVQSLWTGAVICEMIDRGPSGPTIWLYSYNRPEPTIRLYAYVPDQDSHYCSGYCSFVPIPTEISAVFYWYSTVEVLTTVFTGIPELINAVFYQYTISGCCLILLVYHTLLLYILKYIHVLLIYPTVSICYSILLIHQQWLLCIILLIYQEPLL